jgi:hypothetical protein
VEQYHVFTSHMEDPKDEPWFGVEVMLSYKLDRSSCTGLMHLSPGA